MGIQVLGPLAVDGSGRLGQRDRVVLQALATRQGRPVTADELADALWGEHPPASAHKNLQSCIVRLRKALGAQAIETTADGYRLALPADEVDARRFESQVARARQLLELGESDRVAFLLDQALDLWRGTAFDELAEWPPARREAGRLDELRLDAEELLLDAQLRRGRAGEVLPRAHEMVRAAPLRERRWELLALAQYRTGAQGEALRTIRQLRAVLARELGIDPAPDVVALEQSILRQDPSLVVPAARPVTDRCPWQGLMAYDVDDAERFFGRDADVAACLAILGRSSFVALVGPSGSGKSSLLRAGLLSALRGRGHRVVLITPGSRPLQALSALPEDAPAGTVLAVDQAEEVFTLCEDLEERRTFLERLTDEARRRPVVVAVRGDRLTQATEHAGFSRLVEQGLHLVGALDEAGLRDAVERPAHQAGLVIEHGLVELLVREVRDDPGALPLLSHALLETWQRREGNTLTVDGYHASGGIRGAVAQSAEQLYGRIEPDQRRQLRDLMLRLVSPGAEGEAVRARVPRRLVATDADHDRLIESLVSARLVTSDEGVLEITHEALARAWPRLRGWLDDDVEGQRTRHHLSGAADAWDTLGRPDSELYRGVRLTRALDWQSRTESALTDTEREFLAAARAASEAEEHSAVERAREQARLISRLRLVLGGAVVLLVLALVAGGVAAVQSDRASDNAAQAEQSAMSALARGAAARGTATGDVDIALLLAVAGVTLDESPETVGSLQQVIGENPALIRSIPLAGPETMALDVHPDGSSAAALDNAYSLSLVDLDTGAELARRQIGPDRPELDPRRVLRISPDGRVLAVGAVPLSRQLLHVLDAQTLRPVEPQPVGLPRGRTWRIVDAKFSQDSSALVVVMNQVTLDGTNRIPTATRAYVWTRGFSARPRLVDLSRWTKAWAAAALSPDGRLLYTATPTVRVHDLRSGRVRTLSEQGTTLNEVGFDISPDGKHLVMARGQLGNDAVILDAGTGRVRHTLPHDNATFDARFSSDGRRVLTVQWRPAILYVWDSRTGRQISKFTVPAGSTDAVAPLGVGEQVVTSTEKGLHQWDVDGSRRYVRRVPVGGFPPRIVSDGVCFANASADGAYVNYTVCPPVTGFVLDVARRRAQPEQTTGGGYSFGGGSWSSSRAEYVRAVGGTLHVWDGKTGRMRAGPHPVGDLVTEVDHSPDGSRIVVSELSGRLTLLDGTTFDPAGKQVEVGGQVCCVALGPDNRTAFALVGGPTSTLDEPSDRWALVDLEAGKIVMEGALGLGNGIWVDYSPDGRHVAAGGADGDVAIIDTETGRPVRQPVEAHALEVYWVAFSGDGARLVSNGGEGTVVLWDVETGSPTDRVTIAEGLPSSSAFLPDGDVLIVPFSRESAVFIWDPSTTRAVEFACQAVGRDITEAEWDEHFSGVPYRSDCPR